MRRLAKSKPGREPTIALINIVFLMLVFFMVAGTLAQPLDTALTLVETRELDGRAPPDALVIHADGRLSYRGINQPGVAAFFATLPKGDQAVVRLVPDRALPAAKLVEITHSLRAEGAERVMVVTQRGLE